MKLGPILGALAPGLAATGLLGGGAQKMGGNMLMGMSPILAMLLKKKKQPANKQAPVPTGAGPIGMDPNVASIGGLGGFLR